MNITIPQCRRIDLSESEVNFLMAGNKSQIRRAVSEEVPGWVKEFGTSVLCKPGYIEGRGYHEEYGPAANFYKMKYGNPGDRLWVKEKFAVTAKRWTGGEYETHVVKGPLPKSKPSNYELHYSDSQVHDGPWRPAAQMLRWASRAELEIVNVRIEKLQDITTEDISAEGIGPLPGELLTRSFATYWNSLNGTGGPKCWGANPWVWVIDFRRIN